MGAWTSDVEIKSGFATDMFLNFTIYFEIIPKDCLAGLFKDSMHYLLGFLQMA